MLQTRAVFILTVPINRDQAPSPMGLQVRLPTCLHNQALTLHISVLKMEEGYSSETLVPDYKTT
jgi:hypothetical protein